MAKEDYILRLSMFEQEAKRVEEQINMVNQQIGEFEVLKLSLDKVKNSSEEILAPLGRGVFIKAKPVEKEFFINIGKNVVVKRNSEDAGKIIDKQVLELNNIKDLLLGEMERINFQLQEVLEEAQNSVNSEEKE